MKRQEVNQGPIYEDRWSLSEVKELLRGYLLLLLGTAVLFTGALSLAVAAFIPDAVSPELAWLPYALLVCGAAGIFLSLFRPQRARHAPAAPPVARPAQPGRVLRLGLGVGYALLNLAWSVYLGYQLGQGLDWVWRNLTGWFAGSVSQAVNLGWILGGISSGLAGFLVLAWITYALKETFLYLIQLILEAVAVPALTLVIAPLSAILWTASSGNGLLVLGVSLGFTLAAVAAFLLFNS